MKIFREVKGIPEPSETEEGAPAEREGRITMKSEPAEESQITAGGE